MLAAWAKALAGLVLALRGSNLLLLGAVCLCVQDLNPAYNMLLRSELLGCQCPSPISPDKATQLEQMRGASSPSKKILRFKSGAPSSSSSSRQAPSAPLSQ